MTEQELKQRMADLFENHVKDMRDKPELPSYQGKVGLALTVLSLVKQANYVRLADDQSLPENPHDAQHHSMHDLLLWITYGDAQQDMLKAKFRKVEL